MFGNPMEIALIVGAAVLLFGADKLPKLARSAGQAKKEFMVGQAEADAAADRARREAMARAEAEKASPSGIDTIQPNGVGMATPPIEPGAAGPAPTAPPRGA